MATRVRSTWDAAVATPGRRWLLAAGGVVLISAAAVTAGLVLGADAPAVRAGADDAYTAAPGCGDVPADAVEAAVPGARLDAAEHGPLHGGDGATCVWTSVGVEGEPPRSLHVDLTAHYTDRSGEVSGARSAAAELERLGPVAELEGAAPVAPLGEDALAWPSTSTGTAAEVAFRRDNLVVRVYYGGDDGTDGTALPYGAARDGAVAVAERVAEEL